MFLRIKWKSIFIAAAYDLIFSREARSVSSFELFLILNISDARRKPFEKFCPHRFTRDILMENLDEKSAKTSRDISGEYRKPKCVKCVLVDNLYPDDIAPSLYEDSVLSLEDL